MALVINTNVGSLNAQRQLNKSKSAMDVSMERLSSGLRINSAKDDAGGLGIVNKMTAQVKGLNQAVRNANDGISLLQVAEGALQETDSLLQRVRELSVQSANDSNSAADRANIQKEVVQLKSEMNRIADTTTFNSLNVLDGTFQAQKFQVGAFANETIQVSVGSARTDAIGSYDYSTASTGDNATTAATAVGTSTVLGTEDLAVRGFVGLKTIDVAAGDSFKDIEVKVNSETALTGVSADAETKAIISGFEASAQGSLTFNLKGSNTTAVQISAAISDKNDLTNLVTAINKEQAATGITAELSGDKKSVTLTSARGDGVEIDTVNSSAFTGGSTSNIFDFGGVDASGTATTAVQITDTNDSSRVEGYIKFTSSESFTVTSGAAGAVIENTTAVSSSLTQVANVDVSTQAGANSAMSVLDGALAQVANARANLGAVQNRFGSTVSNLENVSQNVSASRSRVLDADFATESANLARTQILQQAGISMLAQANQSTQSVLSLLQ